MSRTLRDLLADSLPLLGFGAQHGIDALELRPQVLVLGADLHFLELAQTTQAHVEDGVRLDLASA